MRKRYQVIAGLLQRLELHPPQSPSPVREGLKSALTDIMDSAPSGSGWDQGTTLDEIRSNGDHLVFRGSFHHMNSNGFYDGWTQHEIRVTPSFAPPGALIRVTGQNRDGIKDYLADLFSDWLWEEIEEPVPAPLVADEITPADPQIIAACSP